MSRLRYEGVGYTFVLCSIICLSLSKQHTLGYQGWTHLSSVTTGVIVPKSLWMDEGNTFEEKMCRYLLYFVILMSSPPVICDRLELEQEYFLNFLTIMCLRYR